MRRYEQAVLFMLISFLFCCVEVKSNTLLRATDEPKSQLKGANKGIDSGDTTVSFEQTTDLAPHTDETVDKAVVEVHKFPEDEKITLKNGENYVFNGCLEVLGQINPIGLQETKGPQVADSIEVTCKMQRKEKKAKFVCLGKSANIESRGIQTYWVMCE